MPTNATNETAVNTTAPGSGDSGGGGGLINVNPGEWAVSALQGLVESLVSGAVTFINAFQHVVFGIDPPGVQGDISTWGPPDNGLWVGAWGLYWSLAGLAIAFLVIQAMRATNAPSERESKQKLAEIMRCGAMVLIGWPVAIGGLHLADAIAMAFVPEGAQFFSTPGNVAKLGLGVVLGSLALVFQTGMALTAIFVVLVERVILIGAVAGWPVWWALRPSDGGFANAASGIGLSMYVGVAGAKVIQSALAYLVFNSEWSFASVSAPFVDVFGSAVALSVTFIGIPIVIGRNFVPEAMTMLGTPAVTVAEDYADDARGRATDTVKDRASAARDRASQMTPSAPSPTWSNNSDDASAATSVPDSYSPTPEPGANAAPSSSSSGTDSTGATDSTRRRVERIRKRRDY